MNPVTLLESALELIPHCICAPVLRDRGESSPHCVWCATVGAREQIGLALEELRVPAKEGFHVTPQ